MTQLSGHDGCVCESLFTHAEHTDLLELHPPTKTSRLHMYDTVGKPGQRKLYGIRKDTEKREGNEVDETSQARKASMVFLMLSAKGEEECSSSQRMASPGQGKQPYIDQGAVW